MTDAAKIQVEHWPIGRVLPYAKNARMHDGAQVAAIAESIRQFGFVNPALVDGDGTLIAGHGRILAAKQLGLTEVPIIQLGYLSAAQARALRLADNKIAENSTWDEQLLRLELAELKMEGFELPSLGFDVGFLESLPGGQSRAPIGSLAETFGVPPFSVLNAREGWWQDRKRGWLALGIQSELGRGDAANDRGESGSARVNDAADAQRGRYSKRANAIPGGSLQPKINPKTGKISRADSRGRIVPGTDAGAKKAAEPATGGANEGQ